VEISVGKCLFAHRLTSPRRSSRSVSLGKRSLTADVRRPRRYVSAVDRAAVTAGNTLRRRSRTWRGGWMDDVRGDEEVGRV